MKCPYCGNEMEIGVVQSDIPIAQGMNGCAKEAQLCKSCWKIIMVL